MAKYRKISPKIWNDAKFRELSDNAKLVFFMLLTHPQTSALGTLRAFPQGLAAELGWSEKAFREAFQEVLGKGMTRCAERAGLIWLPNFMRYNAPESPNVLKSWAGALDDCPECDLKNEVFESVKAFSKDMKKAFQEAFQEAFQGPSPNQEQEQEQEQEQKNTPPKDRSKIQDHARANNGCHVGGGEGKIFSSSLKPDVSPNMAGNGNAHIPEKRTESVFSGTKRQNANNGKGQKEKAPENAVSCETPFYLPEDMDIGFHQFIDAYPANHREPVGEAAAVWRQLSKARKLPGLPKLLDGIASWQATEQWGKENGRFIPKAANFLRNCLWLSSPPPASAASFPTREQLDAEAAQLLDISGRQKRPLCLGRTYR